MVASIESSGAEYNWGQYDIPNHARCEMRDFNIFMVKTYNSIAEEDFFFRIENLV
jgi:hypothetical protein